MALPFQAPAVQFGTTSENGPILEFRAGRMNYDGRRVEPDSRKGLIRIVKTDDGLVHFQWLDRNSRAVEEDQIVFPDEAAFEKVSQTSGRVYILKFKHDDRKFFFWMQEPALERDAALCAQVNIELNSADWMTDVAAEVVPEDEDDEPAEASQRGDDPVDGTPASMGTGAAAASTPSATGAPPVIGRPPAVGQAGVQLADLQSILSSLGQISVPPDVAAQAAASRFSLAEVMRVEDLLPVLQQQGVLERLTPYLPEDLRSLEAISELLQSPQFWQQLELFTHLLQSGQVDLSQFGIDQSIHGPGVAAFLMAIDEQGRASSGGGDGGPVSGTELAAEPGNQEASEAAPQVASGGRPADIGSLESDSKKQKKDEGNDAMDEGK